MTLYRELARRLEAGGIESAALEARVLLKEIAGASDADFIAGRLPALDEYQTQRLENGVRRRLAGEPLSRILGRREFWGLDFTITPDTLDPRPDTETIISRALTLFPRDAALNILDLGTGSGCILVSLLHELKQARGTGLDVNPGALRVAEDNARRHDVAGRVRFLESNWTESLSDSGESFDLIVSNPPYIPESEIESLESEVKNHDPILALSGGKDGLDSYKIILREIKKFLSPGGIILLETGKGQGPEVQRLAEKWGFSVTRLVPDLGGILRVVEIRHGDK